MIVTRPSTLEISVPTKSAKKLNTRWRAGAARYDAKQQAEIDKKYHESSGWRNGAKVSRK
jgi:hypothetical protein